MNHAGDNALFQIGNWVWLQGLFQAGRVIDATSLRGAVSYRVWLVLSDTVINRVSPYTAANTVTPESIDADDFLQPDHASVYAFAKQQAEEAGVSTFDRLKNKYTENLAQEKEKAEYGFNARERAIECIGLTEVRAHRLARLRQEQRQWLRDFSARQKIKPELNTSLILRIKPR